MSRGMRGPPGPEDLARPGEPAAQHDQDVVTIGASPSGQLVGAACGTLARIVHATHGRRPVGARHVPWRQCRPLPPPPPCRRTRCRPSRATRSMRPARSSSDSGRATMPNEAVRFAYVGLCDPPKDVVRAVDSGETVAPRPPGADACSCKAPRPTWSRRIVSVTRGAGRALGDRRRMSGRRSRSKRPYRRQLALRGVRRTGTPPSTAGASWTARSSRSTRGRPARSGSQHEKKPAHHQVPWPTCATSPDDNGYARPLEGLLAYRGHGTGRGARGRRPSASSPSRPRAGSYYPEDNGPLRTDLKPAGDHPAGRPELRGRGQPGALAEVVAAGGHGPARGPGPPHRRLRGRRSGAPDLSTVPRSARWSCPTATRARCTRGRARSTRASGDSGAWPTR